MLDLEIREDTKEFIRQEFINTLKLDCPKCELPFLHRSLYSDKGIYIKKCTDCYATVSIRLELRDDGIAVITRAIG
jgi:hypothetical protein